VRCPELTRARCLFSHARVYTFNRVLLRCRANCVNFCDLFGRLRHTLSFLQTLTNARTDISDRRAAVGSSPVAHDPTLPARFHKIPGAANVAVPPAGAAPGGVSAGRVSASSTDVIEMPARFHKIPGLQRAWQRLNLHSPLPPCDLYCS
jgi:hypothetical protein